MATAKKIVLHSRNGDRPELAALVAAWIEASVIYVGVVGRDAVRIEDSIDALCVGDGTNPYFMLTASHGEDESLDDAVFLAESLSDEFAGPIAIVEF